MTGALDCPSCEKILGIVPQVPIVPSLSEDMHRMWRAYGGFTFAFDSYTHLNLTERVDDDKWKVLMNLVDPINHPELEKVPKLMITGADDQFMMLDQTNMWYP